MLLTFSSTTQTDKGVNIHSCPHATTLFPDIWIKETQMKSTRMEKKFTDIHKGITSLFSLFILLSYLMLSLLMNIYLIFRDRMNVERYTD